MDPENTVGSTLPHSDFGAPDCCGCLNGIVHGDLAQIVCNECLGVVRIVPVADLQKTLDEMELSLEISSARCPHCGAVNVFPGFSTMEAFICRECGEGVAVDGPAQ